MVSTLHYRGPDEAGLFRDAWAGLGHARLSIIDLGTGQQPLGNEDQTLWIVFNGEIFNYLELREELLARGHRFRTGSDTEVIVHAWEEWGEDALRRFNGQWAFALWNTRDRELILSRDRAGIRPLYYAEVGPRVLFGSEVKAIFAGDPGFPRRLDPSGILQTFSLWTVIPPGSVFQGVSELPAGTVRRYRNGEVVERSYWSWSFPEDGRGGFDGTETEAAELVKQTLFEASSLRMLRADVPVGCYLSGGLDSSLVTSLAVEAKGEACKTFSIRFEDEEYDETPYQQMMVNALGTEHHQVSVSQRDICRVFPKVIQHTERPILRTAPAPLFMLSELVRENGIKVVLTGEGADEVFAGYDIFREGIVRRLWAQNPDGDEAPELLDRLYPYLARSPVSQQAIARQFFGQNLQDWNKPGFAHSLRWQTTGALQRLLLEDFRAEGGDDPVDRLLADLPGAFPKWTHLAQDQYLEARTLLTGYLLSSQGDRMLMAHSVEGRFPFLDVNVLEVAGTLPDQYKVRDLAEKHVLKLVAGARLPREILERPKQPYRAPDALSFTSPHRDAWVDEVISREAVEEGGVFDPELVERLWKKCTARWENGQFSNSDNMAIVGVLSTQLLHRTLVVDGPQWDAAPTLTTNVDLVGH